MTKPHRATPEQWETIKQYTGSSDPYSCILELRARIEALEAAQQPPQDKLDRLIALDADDGEPIVLPSSRAALGQPEPVAPTDEEMLKLAAKELGYEFNESWFLTGRNCPDLDTDPCELLNFARAVLARFGTPANQPVPVSERLPGVGDCTAQGWCWVFYRGFATWTLEPPLGQDVKPTG